MLDLILKNTVVYDGTGAPPFHGNIGIAQGKIAVLSQQPIAEKAKEIVDLGGRQLPALLIFTRTVIRPFCPTAAVSPSCFRASPPR